MTIKDFLCKQETLQKQIGFISADSSLEKKEQLTKEFVIAMIAELIELLDSTKWKHWKKNQITDIENIKIEIIDILHFWLNLCLIWGLTEEEVIHLYLKKHTENIKRQEDNY